METHYGGYGRDLHGAGIARPMGAAAGGLLTEASPPVRAGRAAAEEPCDGIIDDEAAKALAGSANFETAVIAAAAALADLQRDHWVLSRLVNDRGQHLAVLTMLDLHLGAGGHGFTPASLRERARLHGFGSPNRVTALAGALRAGGFLVPVPAADSRLRKLAPSEQLMALCRRRFALQLEAQALVRPQILPASDEISNNRFLASLVQSRIALYRDGGQAGRIGAGLDVLAERANATVMLFAAYVAEARGAPLAMSELARRFSVARSHVVSVMKEAEGYGLMAVDRRARTFRPTDQLRQAFLMLFARTFLADALAYDRVFGQPSR